MSEVKVGEIIEGTVIEIRKFGAIMIFPNDDKFLKVSMAKISQEEKEMYRNQSLKRTPVEDEYIDFTALEAKLKEWTKQGD